jgi:phage terminase large subunit
LSTLTIATPRVFAPLLKPARRKGAWGGRGSGKSHFFAELLVERALTEPGLRAVCIREVQHSLRESVKRLIEDKIQAMGVGKYFDVLRETIGTPGGGVIIFQGMQNHTAESIKSLEGYGIAWVEEAQSLSERSLDLLRPTIRADSSELWFSWNPRKPNDPVDKYLRADDPPPGAVVVKANWSDNPWFPDVLRDEMEYDKRRDPDKYTHIWMGEYQRNSEARVFRNWRIEEFETPKNVRLYFGSDWGFSVDPTVLVCCWIDGRRLYVPHEAYQVGCQIEKTPALFDGIPHSRKWPIRADSARPETIDYMKRQGFNISPAVKGPNSVEDGIEFLKNYDIIVHPRCRHTADELSLYSYKTDKLTNEVLPVLEDKENHVIDALRYALEGMRLGPGRMRISGDVLARAAQPRRAFR